MTINERSNYRIGNLIFLSYRRADTAAQTLALKLELEKSFSAVQVFIDNKAIDAGEQYPDEIDHALRGAKVIIAVIGKDWRGMLADGTARIEDENDWVQREVKFALDHNSDSFIPVLLNDAPAMTKDRLPDKLRKLAGTEFIRIDLSNLDSTISRF
jgi:TIR domain